VKPQTTNFKVIMKSEKTREICGNENQNAGSNHGLLKIFGEEYRICTLMPNLLNCNKSGR
jgi:hypothetical protein